MCFEHAEPVRCVAAVPDGRVITGSDDKTVKVWRDGACERTIQADTDHAWAVAMWRTCREERASPAMEPAIARAHRGRIVEAPDTNCAVCGDGEDEAGIEMAVRRLRGGDHLQCLTPPLAAILWATGSARRATAPPAVDDGRRYRAIFAMGVPVVCVAAMADDVHFVVGLGGGVQRGPAVPRRRLVHAFTGHTDAVTTVTVTPDGQHIISGSQDTLVKVWSVANKSLVSTCPGHTYGVRAVAAMPDGQRFLSGGDDNTVRVWLLDGTLENTFKLHGGDVSALVALPDNQHALFGSYDHTVKLFNVNDGAVLRTFTHHTAPVTSLALLPDGLRFVSGSGDKTARIAYHGFEFAKKDEAAIPNYKERIFNGMDLD